MDGRKKKLSMPPIAQAAMRLFLADEGHEIREIDEPKYPKSARRQRTSLFKTIIKNFHFPEKQQKLLEALIIKGSLDINGIAEETNSKAPGRLVTDTRKTIKSYEPLRNMNMGIDKFRRGRKWFYHLKPT
ncbi:hypothetical protein HYS91_05170 [Candidatus Daviesbacteria bacterium]|nr:hypothetical protein [Candidatus Daviesbacteria bacterium]